MQTSQSDLDFREAKGLTQKALGDMAGLSLRAVTQWEQGLREPGWSSVVALCKALEVMPNEFLEPAPRRKKAKPGRPKRPAE